MLGLDAGAPLRIDLSKPNPVRLVAVAIELAAMPHLAEQTLLLDTTHGSDNTAPANSQQVSDPIKAWIALSGLAVKAVDNGGRDPLFRA